MYAQNLKEELRPFMKEEILESILRIDMVFEALEHVDHDIELQSVGADSDQDPVTEALEIENIYKEHSINVLSQLGVILTTEEPPLHLLVVLLEMAEEMGFDENREFIEETMESSGSQLEFFYKFISEFSDVNIIEFYPYVDSFENDSILEIRSRFNDELEDDEMIKIRSYSDRGKRLLKYMDPNDINIVRSFIKSRSSLHAFGFSFDIAVRAIMGQLEYYFSMRDFKRIRSELMALAFASSLEEESMVEKIMEVLSDIDIPVNESLKITGPIEQSVSKILADYNEDNNEE